MPGEPAPRNGTVCALVARAHPLKAAPMPLRQLDLMDLGAHDHNRYRYVMNYTDRFTKHVWLRPLASKSSEEIAFWVGGVRQLVHATHAALLNFLAHLPLLFQLNMIWSDLQPPKRLHTDNGKEFQGDVKRLCEKWGVQTVYGRPYHPQSQGGVERMVRYFGRKRAFQSSLGKACAGRAWVIAAPTCNTVRTLLPPWLQGQTTKLKLRAALLVTPDAQWPNELLRIQRQINDCPTRALSGLAPSHALFGKPNACHSLPTSADFLALGDYMAIQEARAVE